VPRYIDSAIDSSVLEPGVGPPSRLSGFLRVSVIFSYFGVIFFALFAWDNLG
jgi:hypothetical protein